jgi:o-succinylbenzoate synthase
MNDLQLTYSPYTLVLNKPFITSKKEITERNGVIIKIVDAEGNEGVGDCCPFSEFGSETLQDAENALSDIKLTINIKEDEIENSITENLKNFDKLPSLKHGLEQALLNLMCKVRKVTIDELLKLELKRKILVNAAIGFLSQDESVNEALNFVEEGFITIKLKVGRENFDDDLSVVKSVREALGEKIHIRIDPNGKWTLDEAVQNLKKLEQFNIEYVEQPLNESNGFAELSELSNVPIAPDESVRSIEDAKRFIDGGYVSFIILKPMLLGGLIPTLKIIRIAEENKITPVITSSFESAIGRTNAIIAAASVKSNVAHGLAANHYFKNDLVKDQFNVKSGKIILQ